MSTEGHDSAKETAKDLNREYEKFPQRTDNKRILAGIMAIVFTGFGIHKFVLGYNKEGLLTILYTVLSCGVFSFVSFIEGIIYLTKSDDVFYQTYQANKKPWF